VSELFQMGEMKLADKVIASMQVSNQFEPRVKSAIALSRLWHQLTPEFQQQVYKADSDPSVSPFAKQCRVLTPEQQQAYLDIKQNTLTHSGQIQQAAAPYVQEFLKAYGGKLKYNDGGDFPGIIGGVPVEDIDSLPIEEEPFVAGTAPTIIDYMKEYIDGVNYVINGKEIEIPCLIM